MGKAIIKAIIIIISFCVFLSMINAVTFLEWSQLLFGAFLSVAIIVLIIFMLLLIIAFFEVYILKK